MGCTHTTHLLLSSLNVYITTRISFSAVRKLNTTFYDPDKVRKYFPPGYRSETYDMGVRNVQLGGKSSLDSKRFEVFL